MFGLFKKKSKTIARLYLIEYPDKAVNAIKAIRFITGFDLKEAKRLVDNAKGEDVLIYEFDPPDDGLHEKILNVLNEYSVTESFVIYYEEE